MGLKDDLGKESHRASAREESRQQSELEAQQLGLQEARAGLMNKLTEACLGCGLPTPEPLPDPPRTNLHSYALGFLQPVGSGALGLPMLFQLDDILLVVTKGGAVYQSVGWGDSKYIGGDANDNPNIFIVLGVESEEAIPGFLAMGRKKKVWGLTIAFVCTLGGFSRAKLAEAAVMHSDLSLQNMIDTILAEK